MSKKINVLPIITAHILTLRNYATGRMSFLDIMVFFGFPLSVAALAGLYHFKVHAIALNALVSSFSLFATILLSLLVMVFSFIQSTEKSGIDPYLSQRRKLLREISANICSTVLLSVAIVVVSIVALAFMETEADAVGNYTMVALVAAFITFILNILMIVKRMYLLMENELDRSKIRRPA
jgi:hypothetical protein